MIFLFTEIDPPAMSKDRVTAEADHILSSQLFRIEEILFKHGVLWMKRTPAGVLSAFEGGEPANAAIALQKEFQAQSWEGYGKAKLRVAMHVGEAEKFGQSYVGPDLNYASKLLETAYGGQIVLSLPAIHFIPLPPGGRLLDLGVHFLKDLSEPGNIYALQHPSLAPEEYPPLRSLQHFPQNLSPQGSPFYGREEEIQEITGLLTGSPARLVTLVGPGGFGKTRLALQSAAEVVEKFKDGVYLVALAPLLSDQLMVGAIANVIKFFFYGTEDPMTQLLNHLREKEMLLVMDNFEHIIGGSELMEEMLKAAPGLKALVTSRESLRIGGEKVFEVRGLRYPENERMEEMEASSAVQLFVKSAHRIRPDFSLQPGERSPLLRICRLLEGMPLGLELSATWVATLSLPEIAEKIESSRDFLATSMPHLPPRHRSLRAVFEYSWILLSEPQKTFLKAISVFRGGFREQAAAQVAGSPGKALPYLENKSLVRRRSDGRYEIHELLKYYAKEKLFDSPAEKEKAMDAHCSYYARFLRKKQESLFGASQRRVLDELLGEMENIREGWKRALERGLEKEMGGYVDGLYSIYETKGWFQEALEAFQRGASVLRDKYQGAPPMPRGAVSLLAKIISRWALFENLLGKPKKAHKLFEESLALFRSASDTKQMGIALDGLGIVNETLGHFKAAKEYYQKSLGLYRRAKNRNGITLALNHLGHILVQLEDFQQAQSLILRSLSFSERDKDEREMAYSYNLLGDVLHALGRFPEAKAYYQKGLAAYLESGERRGMAWSFTNLGREAEVLGDYTGAHQMYREGMAISRDLGDLRALAWSANLQGFVHWATGEYKEALALYEEGLFLYREVADPRGEAWTLDLMGNLRLAMGEDEEAGKLYLKSYSLVLKEGVNHENVAWNFFHLGALAQHRSQLDEAKGKFSRALASFQRLGSHLGQVSSLTHLGEIACAQKSLTLAEKYFRSAVKLSLKAKSMPLLVNLVAGLAQLLKDQGDEKTAIGLLMAALNHPTCRQQTKDRAVSLALDLKSKFSERETGGILQWAKGSSLEGLAASWLASGKPRPLGRKKKGKSRKVSSRPERKVKPKTSRKSPRKKKN